MVRVKSARRLFGERRGSDASILTAESTPSPFLSSSPSPFLSPSAPPANTSTLSLDFTQRFSTHPFRNLSAHDTPSRREAGPSAYSSPDAQPALTWAIDPRLLPSNASSQPPVPAFARTPDVATSPSFRRESTSYGSPYPTEAHTPPVARGLAFEKRDFTHPSFGIHHNVVADPLPHLDGPVLNRSDSAGLSLTLPPLSVPSLSNHSSGCPTIPSPSAYKDWVTDSIVSVPAAGNSWKDILPFSLDYQLPFPSTLNKSGSAADSEPPHSSTSGDHAPLAGSTSLPLTEVGSSLPQFTLNDGHCEPGQLAQSPPLATQPVGMPRLRSAPAARDESAQITPSSQQTPPKVVSNAAPIEAIDPEETPKSRRGRKPKSSPKKKARGRPRKTPAKRKRDDSPFDQEEGLPPAKRLAVDDPDADYVEGVVDENDDGLSKEVADLASGVIPTRRQSSSVDIPIISALPSQEPLGFEELNVSGPRTPAAKSTPKPRSKRKRVATAKGMGFENTPNEFSISQEAARQKLLSEQAKIIEAPLDATVIGQNLDVLLGEPASAPTPSVTETATPSKAKFQVEEGPITKNSTPVNRTTSVQDAWARRRQMALALTEEIVKAKQISIPNGVERLACALQEKPGNLILSADQTTLEFFTTSQHPPECPLFTIQVNTLDRDPTISPRKANPMTIRFRVIDDSGNSGEMTSFIVAQNDEGYKEMSEFREKVTAARSVAGVPTIAPENATPAKPKPYKCEKCASTFKNKNGLEYHLQKSQTTCNPDFDTAAAVRAAEKKEAKEKLRLARMAKKAEIKSKQVDPVPKARVSRRARNSRKIVDGETPSTAQREKADGDSDSSEDSIFEWAEQVANNNTRASGPANSTRKQYRALPGEIAYLNELAEDLAKEAGIDAAQKEDDLPSLGQSEEELLDAPVGNKDQQKGAAPISDQPEDMTLDKPIVVEPAPKDAAQILVPLGKQAQAASGAQQDQPAATEEVDLTSGVCQEILVNIVESNNGIFPGDKSMWFAFVAVWLKDYQKSRILPESKLCSTILDDLLESKKLRKFEHTYRDAKSRDVTRNIYLSPDYSKKDESFAQMRAVMKEKHPNYYVPDGFNPPPAILERLEQIAVRINRPASTAVERRSPEGEESQTDEFSSAEDEDEVMEDVEEEFQDVNPRARRNANISRGVIKWHIKRRAAGIEPPLSEKTLRRHAGTSVPGRRALAQAERERRYLEEASSPAWGVSAPAYFQNTVTGAWDQSARFRKQRDSAVRKPRGIGSGFAEPITFMQAETGAWSERPFGHGVKPIFARPSRRNIGSKYVQYLGEGFRPVLFPTKNRAFSPTSSSFKRSFEDDDDAYEIYRPSAKRQRVHSPRNVEIDESQDEDFVPAHDEPQDDEFEESEFESHSSRQASFFRGLGDGPGTPLKRAQRQTRNTRRSARKPVLELDDVGTPTYIEPKKLPPGSLENPGLSSLPAAFGLEQQQTTTMDSEFEAYSQVTFLEPSVIKQDSDLKNGSWASTFSNSQRRKYDKVQFDEQFFFTVDTLPYQCLNDDSEEEHPSKQQKSEKAMAQIRYAGKGKIARIKKLVPTRSLTAIPADFHGVTEDPPAVAKLMGVELYIPPSGEYQRKRLRLGNRMSPGDETRFMVTVLVVRILAGGVDQFIDWVIVQTQFPHYSMNHLHKVWMSIYNKKNELIDELGVDFQDAYLVAYQNGTVPPINYDKLLDYNWGKLVKWTMKNLDTSLTPKTYQLTAERKDIKKEYYCTEFDRNTGDAQTVYFGLFNPIYRRLDAAGSKAQAMPIDRRPGFAPDEPLDQLTLIKTWARATALTPMEMWNQKHAFHKLRKFSDDQLQHAIDLLINEKVVIRRPRGKSTTGRSFECSDAFIAPLRRPIPASNFVEAIAYKEYLDSEFRSGKTMLKVDYMGDEGSYMCISHLQASGQIGLKYIGIPMDPMGMGDDAHPYDTKRIPKAKIKWDIEMRPTTSYIFNDDNMVLQNMIGSEPPYLEHSQAIPAWYTISEEVYPDMWKRIIVAVAITVALRSGVSCRGLRMVFKPTLEEWEVGLLMKWGEERGLWEKADEDADEDGGEVDGWVTCRDWWLLLGIVVGEMDERAREVKEVFEVRRARKGKERERERSMEGEKYVGDVVGEEEEFETPGDGEGVETPANEEEGMQTPVNDGEEEEEEEEEEEL